MFQDSLTKKIAEAAAQIKTEPKENEINQKSVEGAIEKIMREELKGNQHKIDANKNNKVDAHDFKLLRAQKEKEKANSQKFGKDVKEEVEHIDEISLDLAKRARDKAEHYVDMDHDDLRMKAFGDSEKQRVKFQKYVDKKEAKPAKVMAKEEIEESELDEAMFPGTKEYEKKYGQSPQQKLKKKGDTVPTAQGEMKKTEKGVVHTRRFSEMVSAYQEHGLKFVASFVKEEPDNEEFTKEVEDQKAKMDGKKKGGDVAKASVQAVKNEETEIQVINADIANGVEQIDIEEGVQQTLRKYVPGYAKHQLNKKMDAQNYEPSDSIKKTVDKDVNYGRYKKVYDKLKKEEVEQIDIEERSLTEPEMKKKEEIVKSMKKSMAGFKQRYGDRAKEVMYATATARAKGE